MSGGLARGFGWCVWRKDFVQKSLNFIRQWCSWLCDPALRGAPICAWGGGSGWGGGDFSGWTGFLFVIDPDQRLMMFRGISNRRRHPRPARGSDWRCGSRWIRLIVCRSDPPLPWSLTGNRWLGSSSFGCGNGFAFPVEIGRDWWRQFVLRCRIERRCWWLHDLGGSGPQLPIINAGRTAERGEGPQHDPSAWQRATQSLHVQGETLTDHAGGDKAQVQTSASWAMQAHQSVEVAMFAHIAAIGKLGATAKV